MSLTIPKPESTRVIIRDASGKEVDWFDPVYSFEERGGHWVIEGVSHFYGVKIEPGMTYEIQDLEAPDE